MKRVSTKINLVYQIVYEILIILLPIATSPYISRTIGAEGLGIYSYSYSIAYYFVIFALLGIKNYGNRVIAQNRENEAKLSIAFSSLLVVHVIISLVFFVAYIIYVSIITDGRVYAAIQSIFVLSAVFDISWFYFGIERFKITVTRSIIIKLVSFLSVFVFVHSQADLWKYCLIMALSTLANQTILWVSLKQYVHFVKPTKQDMVIHIKPLFVLFLPAIAISIYKHMDKIMIGSISNKTQLGYYENAEKVVNISLTIIGAFGTVMLPKMSSLAKTSNKTVISSYIRDSMRYVMCIAFGLAFGMASVSTVFAQVFWGDEFIISGRIIRGLTITMPFIAFANVLRTQYLIPNEKDKQYLCSVLIGALINVIINWILIPRFEAIGAMAGTIVAEMSVCIIQTAFIRNKLEYITYIKNSLPFAVIGCLMYYLVSFLGQKYNPSVSVLLLQIIIGAIFYGGFSVLYLFLIREPILFGLIKDIKERLFD